MQNYEGFLRGANKLNVYNGTRIDAVAPTRLWIDAHSVEGWQMRGFYTVNNSVDPETNIFFRTIAAKNNEKSVPTKIVSESQYCAANPKEQNVGMPYALPALEKDQAETLAAWVKKGAPGPTTETLKLQAGLTKETHKQIKEWENFFNQGDNRHKVVSRYLYEHLFLAHLYFPEEPQTFFRLVRSSTACSKEVSEIATRRPNDNPGVEKFYYCFNKLPGAVVSKTHIPYEVSPTKLKRLEELFFSGDWKVTRLPTYNYQEAENPFWAFSEIPVKARYQFLLDDAQYQVSTFIKGPVCNGSAAVNSIQEQFYVLFINPESELMVKAPGFQDQAQNMLILPGVWGSDIKLDSAPEFLGKLVENREEYRNLRAKWKRQLFPQGYALKDVWDGEGHNKNAILTVLRHDDNAVVMKGAVGDLSKTIFFLDYPLFERLVYNLVVNFDVFGNVGHQLLTRVYMDMIRMEAEEIYLSFIPPSERIPVRKAWYQGLATELKMKYFFPVTNLELPTGISYENPKHAKKEFIEKVLFTRMDEKVRGAMDPINWKTLHAPKDILVGLSETEKQLRTIASVKATDKTPFSRFFPEIAMLVIKEKNGASKVYSLMHNREHQNISWILAESLRLAPKEDTLTIREGFWGSYPNMFFSVTEDQIGKFTSQVLKIKSEKEYKKLVKDFGVSRMQANFWNIYDEANARFKKEAPTQFGYLDLTRYEM
ncbi:MAG: fatty acid cis/trans isomerase [Bdellovibrionales bacterium]|nr:fatty acid cis/trans isomerase [Bdellovibrionales bacterium]